MAESKCMKSSQDHKSTEKYELKSMKYPFTLITMAKIRKTDITNCWWGYGANETHISHENGNGTTT